MVVEEECDECGTNRSVCPACGSGKVTEAEWLEKNGSRLPLTADLRKILRESEDGDTVKFGTVCWECEWEKIHTLEIGVKET